MYASNISATETVTGGQREILEPVRARDPAGI